MFAEKDQKGYSLIEVGIVISIIALFTGSVLVYSQLMFDSTALKEEQTNIQQTSNHIKRLYQDTNYLGLTNTVARNASVFAKAITDNGFNHSWNGSVTVGVATINGIVDGGYKITYADVPNDMCMKLVTLVNERFDDISIEGNLVKAFPSPLDRSAASVDCNSAGVVDIVFAGR